MLPAQQVLTLEKLGDLVLLVSDQFVSDPELLVRRLEFLHQGLARSVEVRQLERLDPFLRGLHLGSALL